MGKTHVPRDRIDLVLETYEGLPPQQRTVMDHIAKGLTSAQIAEIMGLSTRTVEVHRRAALLRLGVRRTSEALAMLLEAQIRALRSENAELRERLADQGIRPPPRASAIAWSGPGCED